MCASELLVHPTTVKGMMGWECNQYQVSRELIGTYSSPVATSGTMGASTDCTPHAGCVCLRRQRFALLIEQSRSCFHFVASYSIELHCAAVNDTTDECHKYTVINHKSRIQFHRWETAGAAAASFVVQCTVAFAGDIIGICGYCNPAEKLIMSTLHFIIRRLSPSRRRGRGGETHLSCLTKIKSVSISLGGKWGYRFLFL